MKSTAPWHAAAWERFANHLLPQLLGQRLPLGSYQVEDTGPHTCRISVSLEGEGGEVEVRYEDLPKADERGLFLIDGSYRVVVPIASSADLEKAQIRCLDEQLCDYVAEHLGEAPKGLHWDEELVRSFLPLDRLLRDFHGRSSSHYLQLTNWLDMHTHIRRIWIHEPESFFHAGQLGRACPLCLPEGPNLSYIREVAQGAEIRNGRLAIVEEGPQAALSLQASMIPFLEHTDVNRLLMGGNMTRQWLVPLDPEMPLHQNASFSDYQVRFRQTGEVGGDTEEALVQTGCEPENPYFWTGHNLLTAFVTWDGYCFEDGLVISEAAAHKMACPQPLEPGDKISNRHGTKGVVSRILPDDQMPKMEDGTPVDLILTISNLISRLNFGQVREAVMGRIARAEGQPAIVPAFEAPTSAQLQERLRAAGLPEDGLEQLQLDGEKLPYRSTAGWVYWGCTLHLARNKFEVSTGEEPRQHLSEYDYYALRQAGAYETIRELFNTLAAERIDADGLAARAAQAPVEPAAPPSPRFADVVQRLQAAGIGVELAADQLHFGAADVPQPALVLVQPVTHPWARNWQMKQVGLIDKVPGVQAMQAANERLARLLKDQAPAPLVQQAHERLQQAVDAYLDEVLSHQHMCFNAAVLFSGRAVLAPDPELRPDQVGLPEEMAWTLFAPQLTRLLGGDAEVKKRSVKASKTLDTLMAETWVIAYRPPGFYDVSTKPFIAFHPVRASGRALRLHPFACGLMDTDFDGDIGYVFLPLSEAAQNEAGQKLTLEKLVAENPQVLRSFPAHDAMWGLARLGLDTAGRHEIGEILGGEMAVDAAVGTYTRNQIHDALFAIIERQGIARGLEVYDQLMRRGFAVARCAGGSLHAFMGTALERPALPATDEAELWEMYRQEMLAAVEEKVDFNDSDFGALWLACRSGARGSHNQLAWYLGGHGTCVDLRGQLVPQRRGLVEGKSPEEFFAQIGLALGGLAQANLRYQEGQDAAPGGAATDGFHVLARARRARRPGLVFPRAVETDEREPLKDADSRLFVGLSAS